MSSEHSVFITGGTGFIGSRLIQELFGRGHEVKALVRAGSERKLPSGCTPIHGDALEGSTYTNSIKPAETFVHLVGVSHPSPAKATEFRAIDLVAAREAFAAAKSAGIHHVVYLSVAHPAPTMQAYVAVREECESLLARTEIPATIVRPWYVLGPGHWWPYLLMPGYALAGLIPSTRETARRLGLVTITQMIRTLAWAVEHPPERTRVLGVQDIKHGSI